MAEVPLPAQEYLTANSKILVNVDVAERDILVVSYAYESKLYQGVLLDSTNRFLPCSLPNAAMSKSPLKDGTEEDRTLFTIQQRFTYFNEKSYSSFSRRKPTKLIAKTKNPKMTVRLRPRQVLCSKCKSVCNENSENVYSTRGSANRKPTEPPDKSPRLLLSENRIDNECASNSPPKLVSGLLSPRLAPPRSLSEDGVAVPNVNGSLLHSKITRSGKEYWLKPASEPVTVKSEPEVEPDAQDSDMDDSKMVLRKKRSVGSMEDLWDENVFEEASKKAKTTPVIKISFGSQGEGTVLKIPSRIQTQSLSESETEAERLARESSEAKAAKKAMKKAKKEAKRIKELEASSTGPGSPSAPEESGEHYRRHKHKVKHKKRHKGERVTPDPDHEKGLKPKLSINLKGLTMTRVYERDDSCSGDSSIGSIASMADGEVPEFPTSQPLDAAQSTVPSCPSSQGTQFHVGDVVWAKLQGFPWWPAKVAYIVAGKEHEWDVNVIWYGSSRSSLIPCDQLLPFVQCFKVRYNKKNKSTGYQAAIRLATKELSESRPDAALAQLLDELRDLPLAQ